MLDAVRSEAVEIEVEGTSTGSPMITLRSGVTLRGGTLLFGAKGVRLTRDNTLDGVSVRTAVDEVAILNDTSFEDLGTLTLRNVTTAGQVLIKPKTRFAPGTWRWTGSTSNVPTSAAASCAAPTGAFPRARRT